MTDNRTTELRRLLDERGVGYKPTRFSMLQTTFTANGVEWIVTEREATGELFVEPRHGLTPEQAIAATLGSEREAELVRAMEDVLRHSTDTVWVSEIETLVDRMVSLGVYGCEVYEGARPWEVD